MPKPQTVIDIEELPGPARSALAYALTRKERPPAMAKRSADLYWLLILAGAGLLLYQFVNNWGSPYRGGQEPAEIALYAIGFGAIAGGILAGRSKKALRAMLKFSPGVYVIGTKLIDARSRKIGVYPLLDERPQIVHHLVNGVYRNTTIHWHGFTFNFGKKEAASNALDVISSDLQALSKAAQENDVERLVVLDPVTMGLVLHESEKEQAVKRFELSQQQKPKAKPQWGAPLVAAIATLALAPATWWVRNYFSLEAAFDKIDSPDQADAWVAHGGDAARGAHKKMELEIDAAARLGKADRLREMLAKYPKAPADLKKKAEAALKARYQETRKAALALSSSEQLTSFIDQVYDRLEAGGSRAVMQINVAHTDSSALQKLDDVVAKDKKLKKLIVPVAKYFSTDDELGRTESVKTAIQTGMGKFFPDDVMVFEATAKDAPTIEIFYVISPKFTKDGYPSLYSEVDKAGKPIPGSLQYPGIQFELGATLQVPGGAAPQKVTFNATPSPTISVSSSMPRIPSMNEDDPGGSLDNSAVYHAMAESAFRDLEGKLVTALGGRAAKDDEEGEGEAGSAEGGGGDSDAPMPAECEELKEMLAKFMACKKIKESERKAIVSVVKAMTDGKDSTEDLVASCAKTAALIKKSTERAGCK